MRLAIALVVLALGASPAAAEVIVRVSGGHVDLAATAAPLADVLDRLGRQTGMKVVYEGPAPRQLVTLSIHGRTPAETVLSVLEGMGVNFALVADPSGTGVQTLVVAGASTAIAASSTAPARTAPGPRRPFGPPPGASPDAIDAGLEDDEEEEDVPADLGIPILPPGGEMADPGAAPDAGAPGATAGNVTGGNAPPAAPGSVPFPPPVSPMPAFSSSPFTPQPQPFPASPNSVPVPAPPNPEDNPASTVPPPP